MAENPAGGGFARFAQMEKRRQKDIAAKSDSSDSGNFANDREKASKAGRKGGKTS